MCHRPVFLRASQQTKLYKATVVMAVFRNRVYYVSRVESWSGVGLWGGVVEWGRGVSWSGVGSWSRGVASWSR